MFWWLPLIWHTITTHLKWQENICSLTSKVICFPIKSNTFRTITQIIITSINYLQGLKIINVSFICIEITQQTSILSSGFHKVLQFFNNTDQVERSIVLYHASSLSYSSRHARSRQTPIQASSRHHGNQSHQLWPLICSICTLSTSGQYILTGGQLHTNKLWYL